jgi:ABC-2 type transport system permease protein
MLLLVWKDLTLMSRDRMGMFFILVFPVLMGLFFGSLINVNSEMPHFKLAYCDEDESEISQSFLEVLRQRGNVTFNVVTRDQAIDMVRRGKVSGAIIVSKGFGETEGIFWLPPPKIEIAVDPSRQAESGMLEGFVMQAIGEIVSKRFQDLQIMHTWIDDGRRQIESADDLPFTFRSTLSFMFDALDPVLLEWEKQLEEQKEQSGGSEDENGGGFSMQLADIEKIDVSRDTLSNKLRSGWDISFPQSCVWAILGVTSGFAIGLVREKQLGTLVRLQAAPLKNYEILVSKACGCYFALVLAISILCMIGVGMGMRPNNIPLLVLAIMVIAYCFVGIMMSLSVIGTTEQSVAGAGWGINVVMAMFGGGMLPLAFMPPFMQTLSNLSPIKWAVLSLEGAIWRGFSFGEMLFPLALLATIGTVFAVLGSWVLSRRQL